MNYPVSLLRGSSFLEDGNYKEDEILDDQAIFFKPNRD